jgi:hypothetical protein
VLRDLNVIPPNVSQELTGDAARFAGQGAGGRIENSKPASEPRQLSSRLLAGPIF